MKWVFWISAAVVAYTYVGYVAWLAAPSVEARFGDARTDNAVCLDCDGRAQ